MSQKLTLEVVTPKRVMLNTEAEYVTIPGQLGELGILPGHIPLVTNLQTGVLSYKNNNVQKKIAVHFGYAEICQDKITILANSAETAEEIKLEAVKADLLKAESELAEMQKDSDKMTLAADLQQQIRMAVTRQNAAQ
jgi:F-type H+-transporting ATPase subunit epsilon